MIKKITNPTRIPVPDGKRIDEHVGRVHTGTASVSVAHMVAPPGWGEPFQQPDFDEVTIVVRGTVRLEYDSGTLDVDAGETVLVEDPLELLLNLLPRSPRITTDDPRRDSRGPNSR